MSCMMLKQETLKTLANALCKLYNTSDCRSVYGMFVDEDLLRLLRDERCTDRHGYVAFEGSVAAMLYRYNLKAYNGRYNENADNDMQIDFNSVNGQDIVQYVDWNDGKPIIADWHIKFTAMLDCYLYQISENATYESKLYKALRKQSRLLKDAIVSADQRYNWKDM